MLIQGESFSHPLEIAHLSNPEIPFDGIFIRAPVLHSLLPSSADSPPLEILARVPREILPIPKVPIENGAAVMVPTNGDARAPTELGPDADIVMVKQGGLLVTSFHPELTGDQRIHEYWVTKMCTPPL